MMSAGHWGGHLESFEELAFPHVSELYGAAVTLLGDRHAAEGAVQAAVLRAWRRFDRLPDPTDGREWLFGILLRELRRPEAHRTTESRGATHQQDDDSGPLAHLRRLPRRCAEVVLLADAYGFTFRDVGKILGLSPKEVEARLSEGRSLLAEKAASWESMQGGGGPIDASGNPAESSAHEQAR